MVSTNFKGKPPDDFEGCKFPPDPLGHLVTFHNCGASLINHLYLLTAKHCVQSYFLGLGCGINQDDVSIKYQKYF